MFVGFSVLRVPASARFLGREAGGPQLSAYSGSPSLCFRSVSEKKNTRVDEQISPTSYVLFRKKRHEMRFDLFLLCLIRMENNDLVGGRNK